MAREQKQPVEDKKPERQKQAFHVSVMPKEFRGRDGLKRPFTGQQPVVMQPPKPPPLPKPEPVKTVTPEQARKATLTPPPAKKKAKVPWALIIGGVVLLVVLGAGAYFFLLPSEDEPAIVRTPPEPTVVVPTPDPDPEPEPDPDPDPEPEPDPFAGLVLPGQDTDSDGLTDVEEVVYGTQTNRPDTDQDGFLDGNEVFHLYHPNGNAPQTLLDTGAVVVIQPNGYRMLALTRWTRQVDDQSGLIVVSAPTGESFQVLPQSIQANETLNQWYARNVPVLDQQTLEPDRTKEGYVMVWTEDRLTAYVRFSDEEVLVFTYNLGSAQRVQYRQTFEMFINSLERVQSEV